MIQNEICPPASCVQAGKKHMKKRMSVEKIG